VVRMVRNAKEGIKEGIKAFNKRMSFRLFGDELGKLQKVVRYASVDGWERKYESDSHFVRCAVIRLIREELSLLKHEKGRPRKLRADG